MRATAASAGSPASRTICCCDGYLDTDESHELGEAFRAKAQARRGQVRSLIVLLTLFNLPAEREYYRRGAWDSETFYGALVRHAGDGPDAPALRDARVRLNWREVLERVDTTR